MADTPAEAAADDIQSPQPESLQEYVPPRALFIVAHADDIEFGCAGTAARWAAAGSHITYCIVTDNGSGTDDPEMTRERLVAIREAEQRAAAAVCGVHDLIFLGYPDGTVENTLALRKELVRIIRQVKPDVLVTMDPTMLFTPGNDYINHPDHRAVCQCAIDAVFPAAGNRMIFPDLLAEGYAPHSVTYVYLTFSMESNLTIDTSATFETKIDALRKHTSQIKEDNIREFISTWDKQAGEKVGFAYGEAFRVIKIS